MRPRDWLPAKPGGFCKLAPVAEYQRGEAQIRELVKQGKVSQVDADKRLVEMRKAIRREK